MSSLSNAIKASQYTNFGVQEVKLLELASNQGHNEPAGIPAVRGDAGQSQGTILQEASEQAEDIVENARSYTVNQLREFTMQMNEKTSYIRTAGYREGFSKSGAKGFEKGHSEDYEKGYEWGLQEGREAGIQELQEQSDRQHVRIARLTEDLEQSEPQILEGFRSETEALSMQIAHKVLHQGAGDRIAVPAIASGMLEEYHDQEWACVHASPRAAELLQADPQLMEHLQSVSKNLRVVSSASLEDSDCQIDLPDRQLGAGVET